MVFRVFIKWEQNYIAISIFLSNGNTYINAAVLMSGFKTLDSTTTKKTQKAEEDQKLVF